MIRRTFGQAKAQLARISGATGMIMSDSRVMAYSNDATEELMQEGDFPSLIDRFYLKAYGGDVTLPQGYERFTSLKVNGIPQTLQSPWFEFIGFGPELLTYYALSNFDMLPSDAGVLDRGDVCTFKDIPHPSLGTLYTLRLAATTVEDSGVTIIVQGLDANGDWIRSNIAGTWIDGIEFVLSGTPQAATNPQTFSKITAVIKPVTHQPVNCYMIPVGGSAQTQIAIWGATDTNPSYRRYNLPALCEFTQYTLLGRVRRRFQPIVADGNELLIPNIPAMKAMIQAVYYAEAEKPEQYVKYKSIATDILNKEAKAYIGQQRTKPAITFGEGMAQGRAGLYVQ